MKTSCPIIDTGCRTNESPPKYFRALICGPSLYLTTLSSFVREVGNFDASSSACSGSAGFTTVRRLLTRWQFGRNFVGNGCGSALDLAQGSSVLNCGMRTSILAFLICWPYQVSSDSSVFFSHSSWKKQKPQIRHQVIIHFESSMHTVPGASSLLLAGFFLLSSSPASALTCYSTTPPAQAPVADDCTYILNKLPAITLRPDIQEANKVDNSSEQRIALSQPLPGAYQLPAHFKRGSCGIAIRANVPGGGPNPPQRGAILPAGGSVVGDTCIPVRFTGDTLTTFWSVAKDAGQNIVSQCTNRNQQAGIEWGTFLPKQGPPYDDDPFDASPGLSTQDPGQYNSSAAGPSDYGIGYSDEGAGPSNYQNASIVQRGFGGSARSKGSTVEPRGVGSSSQSQHGPVEALFGVWIAGSDMPRDSLANIYDLNEAAAQNN